MNEENFLRKTKNIRLKYAFLILFKRKSGYVENVLSHPKIGSDIALYYGKVGKNGYGLAHIAEKHPSILPILDSIIKNSTVKEYLKDRIILETPDHKAVIDLVFNTVQRKWLVTAYEKIK